MARKARSSLGNDRGRDATLPPLEPFSRREFLVGMGIAGIGLALPGCTSKPSGSPDAGSPDGGSTSIVPDVPDSSARIDALRQAIRDECSKQRGSWRLIYQRTIPPRYTAESEELRAAHFFRDLIDIMTLDNKPTIRKQELIVGSLLNLYQELTATNCPQGDCLLAHARQLEELLNPSAGDPDRDAVQAIVDDICANHGSELSGHGLTCQDVNDAVSGKGVTCQGANHYAPDYPRILGQGLGGLLADIDEAGQSDFYTALRTTVVAAQDFIGRYGDEASQLAGAEQDQQQAQEYKTIADTCHKLTTEKPATFREAVQLTHFIHLLARLTGGVAVSLGRPDQYLEPFRGDISDVDAAELLACLILKSNEMGSAQVISLTVGGQTPSGGDATNRTSFLFLNALRMARVPYPNVTVRLHQQTPKEFVPECVRSVQMGLGHPAFYSDAAIVTGLTSFGIPQEHARDYHVMGCNEVMISGRCRTYKAPNVKLCDFSNLASASPKSFDDLLTAYDGALQKKIDDMQPIGWTWCDPFASAMTSKCVERGLDLHAGGAEYWLSGVWGMGLGTAADSLAAMKKVLFDDKQATASELVAAIQANFAGQYATLQQLLRDAPKYGNDEGSDSDPNRVDKLAAHVAQVFCDAVKQRSQQSQQQGKTMFLPMLASFRMHVETTTSFPATPDGRNATRPISDSASPSQGQGKEGVTCVLHAASNIDFSRSAGGSSFNVKLLPSLVAGDTGRQMLACLVNTYLLDMGGGQIQINVVTSDDLQDAIDNPDRHRDLLVRVAGFCAYFVDLDVALQKEIVSRLEQENWAACWPSCS